MLVYRFASLAIVGLTMGCGAANPPASPDPAASPPEPAAPEAAPAEPAASAPATAEPAATKPPPAPSGIRTAKGIQIGGRPIETITAADVARVLSAAGYEVRTGTPQPCGNVDQLNFNVGNDAVSAMVAVFRIIEPAPGDDCSPTPVSGYVKTWRHATEGDSPTTVMVYDEAAPSLVVVNAMGMGGQPEAHKVIDALLASPGTR